MFIYICITIDLIVVVSKKFFYIPPFSSIFSIRIAYSYFINYYNRKDDDMKRSILD